MEIIASKYCPCLIKLKIETLTIPGTDSGKIILKNTFQNTIIVNKPDQNSTSILLDLDNFFN